MGVAPAARPARPNLGLLDVDARRREAGGHRTNYLHNPREWRRFDGDLWDFFCWTVWGRRRRHLVAVENEGLVPEVQFYRRRLPVPADERAQYFGRFFRCYGADLVFFDPDNGIECPSAAHGRTRSDKHLYWPEIEQAFNAGSSVLVYQDITHRNREEFTQQIVADLRQHTEAEAVWVFEVEAVSFLLVSQRHHLGRFAEVEAEVRG